MCVCVCVGGGGGGGYEGPTPNKDNSRSLHIPASIFASTAGILNKEDEERDGSEGALSQGHYKSLGNQI